MLEETLSDLNFTINEQKIILCLAQNRENISAGAISKRINIKRPTTYLAIESLVEKGYINRIKSSNTSLFSLVDTEILFSLLENRAKTEYSKKLGACKDLKNYFSKLKTSKGSNKFKIETLKSADAVYEQLFKVISKNNFDGIFNPKILFNNIDSKSKVKSFLKETEKRKNTIREIIVECSEAKWYVNNIKNPNHKYKFVPENTIFESDIIILDSFVIISHYNNPEDLAIKINHKAYRNSKKSMFELLWKSL